MRSVICFPNLAITAIRIPLQDPHNPNNPKSRCGLPLGGLRWISIEPIPAGLRAVCHHRDLVSPMLVLIVQARAHGSTSTTSVWSSPLSSVGGIAGPLVALDPSSAGRCPAAGQRCLRRRRFRRWPRRHFDRPAKGGWMTTSPAGHSGGSVHRRATHAAARPAHSGEQRG